jgi:hypothetical protein
MMTLKGFRPKWPWSNRYGHSICLEVRVSGVPRNFIRGGGGSTNSVEDRVNGDLGAVAS